MIDYIAKQEHLNEKEVRTAVGVCTIALGLTIMPLETLSRRVVSSAR